MLKETLAAADTAFRKSAMWAYALNQSKSPHQCTCEHFEDGEPAPIRNPDWWKKIADTKREREAVSVDAWATELFGAHALERRKTASAQR